jgi:hypothetical protein
MDSATIFVLFLTIGFLAFVTYLGIRSRHGSKNEESEPNSKSRR